jgi:hypothetical protein
LKENMQSWTIANVEFIKYYIKDHHLLLIVVVKIPKGYSNTTLENNLQSSSSVLENSGPLGKIWGLIIMAAHLLEASTRNIIFIMNHKNQIRCSWNISQSTRKLEGHKMSPLEVWWTPNVESRPILTDELIEFEN